MKATAILLKEGVLRFTIKCYGNFKAIASEKNSLLSQIFFLFKPNKISTNISALFITARLYYQNSIKKYIPSIKIYIAHTTLETIAMPYEKNLYFS